MNTFTFLKTSKLVLFFLLMLGCVGFGQTKKIKKAVLKPKPKTIVLAESSKPSEYELGDIISTKQCFRYSESQGWYSDHYIILLTLRATVENIMKDKIQIRVADIERKSLTESERYLAGYKSTEDCPGNGDSSSYPITYSGIELNTGKTYWIDPKRELKWTKD